VDVSCATDESAGLRTAKSCGPDAPMLASTRQRCLRIVPGMVTTSPAKETVKTIARGMPGVSVVTNSYAFYLCIRGCGRIERPAFPAPSTGRKTNARLGRFRCGIANACLK
jgi:hypothetical protein